MSGRTVMAAGRVFTRGRRVSDVISAAGKTRRKLL
jgi:hypothetical protein